MNTQRYFTLLLLGTMVAIGPSIHAGVWTADTEPDISPSNPQWEFTGDLYDREYVAGDYLRINSMAEGALERCYFQIVNDPFDGLVDSQCGDRASSYRRRR